MVAEGCTYFPADGKVSVDSPGTVEEGITIFSNYCINKLKCGWTNCSVLTVVRRFVHTLVYHLRKDLPLFDLGKRTWLQPPPLRERMQRQYRPKVRNTEKQQIN